MSFNLNLSIGALEIGVLVSYVLFGVTTTQTHIYYGRFPKDSRRLKSLVAFVWCCELAHAICIGHSIHVMTVTDFGHPERLVRVLESFVGAVLFSAVIAAVVQGFFAFRIYRLSKSLYIPCLSWTLSLTHFICALFVFDYGLHASTLQQLEAQSRSLLLVWGVSAANDLLIATALVHWFHGHRGNAGSKTTAIVDKLISWTIETGVITSALGIATLVLFLTMGENYLWLACFTVVARLFANSLLASLNSRLTLRIQDQMTHQLESPLSMPQFNSPLTVELSKVTTVILADDPES